MIETTLHITSYNRHNKLRNCIDSFFATCDYDMSKLELIIVDNGSTCNKTLDYIRELKPPCAKYNYILNPVNLYPDCLRFAKIQAREVALGNFFVDCPDDHLFIVKNDWLRKCIARLTKAKGTGCVVHFAQPAHRWNKPNNHFKVSECGKFAISSQKGYADYHVMTRETYEKLGKYEYTLGRKAESEYMTRALTHGYFRNILLKPVAIVNDDGYNFVKPLDQNEYYAKFDDLLITNEQLTEFAKRGKYIEEA